MDVRSFASKTKLASLKTQADKIYVDLAKLSNIVENNVVKKTKYDKLIAKVNGIDTTGFVLKTTYDTHNLDLEKKISDVIKKISDVTSLVKKIDYDTKINEIEDKIPDVSSLITKTHFNTKVTEIEGKIPDISSLKTKTDFDAKLEAISDRVTKNKSKHFQVFIQVILEVKIFLVMTV